jgi:HAE1 family hydrophobic/amphiphilic exporter-1
VLVFSAIVLALTGWLFVKIPKGFLPTEDQGLVFGSTEAAQGIGFPAMREKQLEVASIIRKHPDVANLLSSAGPRGNVAIGNSGIVLAQLKPRDERKHTADEIIQQLRPQLSKVPGIRVYLQVPPPIRLGGSLTKSQYQYTLQDADTAELYKYAPILEQKVRGLSQVQDVTSDMQLSNPQLNVRINRDRASALGISTQKIEDALYTAYGTRQISTIYAANNQYQVIMELGAGVPGEPGSDRHALRPRAGRRARPARVARRGRARHGPAHRGAPGPAARGLDLVQPETGRGARRRGGGGRRSGAQDASRDGPDELPGTAQAFQSSIQGLGLLLVVAIVVIYMVLGILYESFIHPLTILTALPFAGFGALVTLMLFDVELSIYAFVGIVMLVGLVKKNGIMMVDFAIEAERGGKSAPDAIYEACVVRFRPIMMTTMAALMGTLPIAMGVGAGAESRRPLGLAVVGGLLFSQLLTLYVTPVFYIYMDRLQKRLNRRRAGSAASGETSRSPRSPTRSRSRRRRRCGRSSRRNSESS